MIAASVRNWLGMLEAACAQISTTCLDVIIDQAGGAPLLPSVLSVDPPLPWYSLFTGLPEEGAADLAPLLVRVDLEQPMQRHWLLGLMHERGGCSQLLVLASFWPFQTLAQHLSTSMEASNGGRLGLLRFYDPRLFALLFSHVLDPDQQQLWLRPAVFWSWLDLDGLPQHMAGVADIPPSLEGYLPLELTDQQLETLGCASDAIQAMEGLKASLPPEWGAQQLFQACYGAMLQATEAGLLIAEQREAFTLNRLCNA